VVLTPKAFDTLVLLIRNSGHLLEKGELIRTLWPASFVEEGNLANNIFVLRKALGEDPNYIETIPKRGYRLVGAVPPVAEDGASRSGKSLGWTARLCLTQWERSFKGRSDRRLCGAAGLLWLGCLARSAADAAGR
jgi:hypothetical protein